MTPLYLRGHPSLCRSHSPAPPPKKAGTRSRTPKKCHERSWRLPAFVSHHPPDDGRVDAYRAGAWLLGGGATLRGLAGDDAFPRFSAGGTSHHTYRRHPADPGAGGALAGRRGGG